MRSHRYKEHPTKQFPCRFCDKVAYCKLKVIPVSMPYKRGLSERSTVANMKLLCTLERVEFPALCARPQWPGSLFWKYACLTLTQGEWTAFSLSKPALQQVFGERPTYLLLPLRQDIWLQLHPRGWLPGPPWPDLAPERASWLHNGLSLVKSYWPATTMICWINTLNSRIDFNFEVGEIEQIPDTTRISVAFTVDFKVALTQDVTALRALLRILGEDWVSAD